MVNSVEKGVDEIVDYLTRFFHKLQLNINNYNAPLAQLDRALAYGARGWGFKSLMAHKILKSVVMKVYSLKRLSQV